MTSLYELNKDLLSLLERMESIQPTDDDPDGSKQEDQLIKEFEKLSDSIDTKMDNIAKRREETKSDILKIDNEISRLNSMTSMKQKRINMLEGLIDVMMKSQGIKEKETVLFKFNYRKSPAKLIVHDEQKVLDIIPDELKKYSIDWKELSIQSPELRTQLEAIGFGFDTSYNKSELKSWINTIIDGMVAKQLELVSGYATKNKKEQAIMKEERKTEILETYKLIYEFTQDEKLQIK